MDGKKLMLFSRLISWYKHLSILSKLLIPQIIALIIGMGYITYTYQSISKISDNYTNIKDKMIPALEKSKTNLMLLKQIANDFTFATISSEEDFLKLPQKYNKQILHNLSTISDMTGIDTSSYQRAYKRYFDFTYNLIEDMIKKQSQDDKKIEKVLNYYNKTRQDFIDLNQQVDSMISQKTSWGFDTLKQFHKDILLFGVLLYLIISIISLFIYKGLQKNFLKLISDISTVRQSGTIKEKIAQFSKNEFGMLAQELNAVFKDFNEAYQNLENIANQDKLTQLYNRVYMDKKIEELTKQKQTFGIIIIDIDHFKRINDNYGHITGDYVLKTFANVIKTSVSHSDILGRWGGEEFLVLVPKCDDIHRLKLKAEKIRISIEDYEFEEVKHITASFGCSIYHPNSNFSETLIQADKALYKAKDRGRNRVEIL